MTYTTSAEMAAKLHPQRFLPTPDGSDAVEVKGITVDIDDEDVIGDHRTVVPSISITLGGQSVFLTWVEARVLARAITQVTDVAEFG